MTTPRSVIVDGPPLARIGHVKEIVPIDAQHADVLGYWHRRGSTGWRVWRWTFADGALAQIGEGSGDPQALARSGRVFVDNGSFTDWQDLDGGREGQTLTDGDDFVTCTPDGRHIITQRIGRYRVPWMRVVAVEGGDEFPEARLLTFSADGRHAVHHDDSAGVLVRTDLGDRRTATIALGPGDWRGLCALRGTSRVLAWTAKQLAVVDLVALRVIEVRPFAFASVCAAAGETAIVADHRHHLFLLDLRDGRSRELGPICGHTYALSDDGRQLLRALLVLDVIDVRSGAVHSAHSGHTASVREAVWTGDGAALATSDDDGHIHVHRLAAPSAPPARLSVPIWPHIAFLPDGRLCALTEEALHVLDPATGAVSVCLSMTGKGTRSLAPTGDGRVVVPLDRTGVGIIDLATGERVDRGDVIREDNFPWSRHMAVAGDRIFILVSDRIAHSSIDARYVLTWAVLDLDGELLDRGSWTIDHAMEVDVELDGSYALVHGIEQEWFFRVHDLSAPRREPPTVTRAGEIVAHRRGRVLVYEGHDLVLRDGTGRELARITCTRDVWKASLSPDTTHVAVVYRDMGVEVFALA